MCSINFPTHSFIIKQAWGFPGGSAPKESACNGGDLGSIPRLGRSPGERNSYPLQYSSLENSMDYIVHRVAKSQTGLSDFHFLSSILMTWMETLKHVSIQVVR